MSATDPADNEFHDLQVAPTRGFFPILWQRKALVILGILLGLAGGFLFYWQSRPVYQSTALVLVIEKGSQPLPLLNDPRKDYYDDYTATHVVIMKSPEIVDKAVQKKGLASLRTFEGAGDPVGTILNSLTVTREVKEFTGGAQNIVYLAYRGPVADDCGKILTAIIESYQEYLDVKFRNVSNQTLDTITKARDTLKGDLAKAEADYKAFRDSKTPLIMRNKEGGNPTLDRIAEIEKKRSGHIIRMEELKQRIKALEEAIKDGKGSDTLIALLRSGEPKAGAIDHEKTLSEQLLPLKAEERKLLHTLDKDHPDVKAVRGNMELIEEHHKKMEARGEKGSREKDPAKHYLAVMQAELKDVELVFNGLSGLLKESESNAIALSKDELAEEQLRSEVTRHKAVYDAMIKHLTEISLVRESGGFDASRLQYSGAGVKVAPSAFQMIVGGLMLGLLVGIGLAFLADLTDKGFRSPDEVRRRLSLPLLGHVPFLRPDPETARKIEAGEVQTDPLLFALYRPKSLEAEAYRAIRTALLFSVQGEGHRVIQVTSPNKGDGKSLLIANLAISIAQAGKRVLLIDCDCRRPRQQKIFNLSNNQGLVNVVRQEQPWAICMQPSGQEGLWVLPSGPVPPNPAELLASPLFTQFLEKARQDFDLVLVDTPPLLAVTDPCIVAGRMDGVVLTLRLSRQGRPQAERACEIMKSLKVNVFGVVVNGVTRQVGGGLYSSDQYDYAESYADQENTGQEDAYYYHYHDEPSGANGSTATAPVESKKAGAGLWSRLFSRKT